MKVSEEKLQKLYVEENRTQREIADIYGWSSTNSTRYYLNKFDIDKSEEKKHKARIRKERENIIKENIGSIESLQNLANECKTFVELSEKSNIKRKTLYTLVDEGYIDFETQSQRLQQIDNEEKIRKMYVEKNLTQQEVADKLGCGRNYVRKLLKKYNIPTGNGQYKTGSSHSEETIRKMRLSAIRNIKEKKGQVYPNYNPEACRIIEEYGNKKDYNFQHAENGGEYYISELGYWVDGYDSEANVVIEVDEDHHFTSDGYLKNRDIKRQQEIEEHLDCKFIRIKL
jgi:transposase